MKVKNLVPEIYYKESRDFSYIGRLFEILFNYIKTGADLVNSNPLDKNISKDIIDLVASTVGFETKHDYHINDLIAICSAFSTLLKNKGSEKVIEDTINILLHSQNIEAVIPNNYIRYDENDKQHIKILIPYQLQDLILVEDIFEYILPAGMTYSFLKVSKVLGYFENYDIEDTYMINNIPAINSAQVAGREDSNGYSINTSINDYSNRSMTYTGTVVGRSVHDSDDTSNNEENI